MKKTFCIYQIRNKRTNKIYYGSASSFNSRYNKYSNWVKHHNKGVREDAKAGDEFYYELITDEFETRDAAYEAEQVILDFFDSAGLWDTIYNVNKKVDKAPILCGKDNHAYGKVYRTSETHPEWAENISKSVKKAYKENPELRKKCARIGSANGMYNRKGKDSPLYKIPRSQHVKDQISNTLSNRQKTQAHKDALSKSLSGENHPNWGLKRLKKTCDKIGNAHRGMKRPETGKKNMKLAKLRYVGLTIDDVTEIRKLWNKYPEEFQNIGYTRGRFLLAKIFNVSFTTVRNITSGHSYNF